MSVAGAEEGAASLVSGSSIHELVHDPRHLFVAYVLGVPQVQRAIDFENAAGPALVSRGVQRSIGLLT